MIYILLSSNCRRYFETIAENMRHILNKSGISVQICIDKVCEYQVKPNDTCIVFWNYIKVLPRCKCIIYNFDPMVPWIVNMFNQFKPMLKSNDIVLDYCYSKENEKLMNLPECVQYQVLPYGYSEYHEHLHKSFIKTEKTCEEDIDILFYGNVGERRSHILNNINLMCQQKGYKIVIRNNDLFLNDEKAGLINRSKIIVSIYENDAKQYKTNDLVRLSYLISNKKFVVTEFIGDKIVEGMLSKYLCYAKSPEDIVTKLDYYLQHPNERDMSQAYECFKRDFPFGSELLKFFVHPINYVIATYSGKCYSRIRDSYSPTALEYQLKELLNVIKTKFENNLINHIQRVTIVVPQCKPEHMPPFEGYYGDKEKWVTDFAEYGVELEYIDYIGENNHHSYDQWIQGMKRGMENREDKIRYNVIIEDDYYVRDPLFDQYLINEYNLAFADNIGYLCSLCHIGRTPIRHAAISNGMISTETCDMYSDMLKEFYSLPKIHNFCPQLYFTMLFINRGIPIKDYSQRYNVLFWNSVRSKLESFTENNFEKSIFIPVQQS